MAFATGSVKTALKQNLHDGGKALSTVNATPCASDETRLEHGLSSPWHGEGVHRSLAFSFRIHEPALICSIAEEVADVVFFSLMNNG